MAALTCSAGMSEIAPPREQSRFSDAQKESLHGEMHLHVNNPAESNV